VRLDPADVLMVEDDPGDALIAAVGRLARYGAVRYVCGYDLHAGLCWQDDRMVGAGGGTVKSRLVNESMLHFRESGESGPVDICCSGARVGIQRSDDGSVS